MSLAPAANTDAAPDQLGLVAAQMRVLRSLPGVIGTLVATTDGRDYLNDLSERSPGAAAAITASSLGLASRLGDLTGPDCELQELQVRSATGYVCLYVINADYLLTIVTSHAVNLARLKLEVRDVIAAVNRCLPLPKRGS